METVRAQVATSANLKEALSYARSLFDPGAAIHRFQPGESTRVELRDGLFAIDAAYLSKVRPEGFFESHRKYVDVQVIVAGEEIMELEDVTRLTVSAAYDPERDLIKYADSATASVLRLRAGDVAVFFPEDGHMPSLQWHGLGLVRKTVVKVPVG